MVNKFFKTASILGILALTSGFFFASNSALAAGDAAPPIRIVSESKQQLIAFGCVPMSPQQATSNLPPNTPLPVIASNSQPGDVYLCSTETAGQLHVKGQVAGVTSTLCTYGGAFIVPVLCVGASAYDLSAATINNISGTNVIPTTEDVEGKIAGAASDKALNWLGFALFYLAYMLAKLGNWLLHTFAGLITFLFSVQKFVTHPFVQTGWPFIQGISNIGFIIALLYIALGNTLEPTGIMSGVNVRRALPRLLIAAILINFSLIIGGILIDFSRIAMAVLSNTMGAFQLEDLPAKIVAPVNQSIGTIFFNYKFNGITFSNTFKMILSAIEIWGVLAALIVLIVGLFTRYIMLLLLLTFSPIAYLAFVLPNTEKWARKWWELFIKYVMYAPAALFVLILMVQIGNADFIQNMLGNVFGGAGDAARLLENLVSGILTIALLLAAASVGKYMGIAGSSAAMSFVGAQGKKLGRGGLYAGRVVGGIAAKPVTVPAKYLGQAAKNQTKDFLDTAKKSITGGARAGNLGPVAKFIAGPERDKDGKLKAGQTSGGKKFAKTLFGGIDPQEQANKKDKEEIEMFGKLAGLNVKTPSADLMKYINPDQLKKGHITKAWGMDNIKVILSNTENSANVMSVAKNDDFLRSIAHDQAVISDLIDRVSKNGSLSPQDRAKFASTLSDNLKKVREA
jgi:hypothetical protein